MARMNLDGYQPKYGQDPAVFNKMYMDYIEQINNDNVSDVGSAQSVPS